ncbi:ATP-binding protein [Kitasatospora sp. NPDC004240]
MCDSSLPSPALSSARRTLRDAMVRAGWGADSIADAELALVELIVNAWRHGGTGSPAVLILILDRTLRVSVTDQCSELPRQGAENELAECGRGLQLVQGLSHRWGAEPQKEGKAVWFELDAAA